jgi:uncharacterized protein (DUF433 family)
MQRHSRFDHIVRDDPEELVVAPTSSGRWRLAGTRIPIRTIADAHALGADARAIASDYGVQVEAVEQALAFIATEPDEIDRTAAD